MSFAAFLIWVGRFLFLGLFLFFMARMYRALYETHAKSGAAARPGRGSARASRRTARLVVEKMAKDSELYLEERDGKERRLREGSSIAVEAPFTMGRSRENDLRIIDSYVSAHHCIVHPGPDGFRIEDRRTTNGTHVDGRRIHGSAPLQSGSLIQVGSIQLRFEVT